MFLRKLIDILKKIKKNVFDIFYNFRVHFKYKIKIFKSLKISDTTPSDTEISDKIKTAVHFHVFYVDLLDEIYSHISAFKESCTIFITVVNDNDLIYAQDFFKNHSHAFDVKIIKVENRGRDIYPFYLALHDCYKDYDYIGHFHTKKSLHTDFGNIWRKYLYDNLIGNNCLFDNIINYFEKNKSAGFVTTPIIPLKHVIEAYYSFAENRIEYKKNIQFALDVFKVPVDRLYARKKNLDFPCGNMFIAKTDAVKQFFEVQLEKNDFPDEKGQLTDTLQHYVELMWKYIVLYNGYKYIEVLKK